MTSVIYNRLFTHLVVPFGFQFGEMGVEVVGVHHLMVHLMICLWMHPHSSVHTRHFVFFLPLHPPILEPDFNLSFCKAKCVGDFYPSSPREVSVEMEFFLQLQSLVAGVRGSLSFCFTV